MDHEAREATRHGADIVIRSARPADREAAVEFDKPQSIDARPDFRHHQAATELELRLGRAICREQVFHRYGTPRPRAETDFLADVTFDQRPGLFVLLARAALAELNAFNRGEQ